MNVCFADFRERKSHFRGASTVLNLHCFYVGLCKLFHKYGM